MMVMYEGDRIIVVGGACSRPVSVVGTVLPGCSLANTASKVLLYRLLRRVDDRWPLVRVKNVVDDIALQSNGLEDVIVPQMAGAALLLVIGLRTLELPLSLPKTAYMASSTRLAARLAYIWRSYGFQ